MGKHSIKQACTLAQLQFRETSFSATLEAKTKDENWMVLETPKKGILANWFFHIIEINLLVKAVFKIQDLVP